MGNTSIFIFLLCRTKETIRPLVFVARLLLNKRPKAKMKNYQYKAKTINYQLHFVLTKIALKFRNMFYEQITEDNVNNMCTKLCDYYYGTYTMDFSNVTVHKDNQGHIQTAFTPQRTHT